MGREIERQEGERQCGQRDQKTGESETVWAERSKDRREKESMG